MAVRINDKSQQFLRAAENVTEMAFSRMANDISTKSKIRVPFKSGNLQKQIFIRKISSVHFQIWADEVYAHYQERGERADGTHKVRKYTTPGTGKQYLSRAGGEVVDKAILYYRQASNILKI
jgi:hypothetical protein